MYVARNILREISDAEECLNDTYLTAWNLMPPQRPLHLPSFLYKIIRNHSLNRFAFRKRSKRCADFSVSYDELSECIDGKNDIEDKVDEDELAELLNEFLGSLEPDKRVLFVRKYWYFDSTAMLSQRSGLSEENVRITLMRLRQKLRTFLNERGILQ